MVRKKKAAPALPKSVANPECNNSEAGPVSEIVGGIPPIKPGQRLKCSFANPNEIEAASGVLAVSPTANGAEAIRPYAEKMFNNLNLGALDIALQESAERVRAGDMSDIEAMLVSQASVLQSMFAHLARRTVLQTYQQNYESCFRMAMKAQNQCRMTLETLATIKNPPVVFAKQANISNGPQQVNNGVATSPTSRAREEKTIQSNELLEEQDGERLDTGATGAAIGADQELATVGKFDRTANSRG